MREIKFRAWDDILKTYDHACDIAIKPNGEIIFDDVMDTYKPADFIIEQFTGLHDCEGKEIYEGDILGHNGKKIITVSYDVYEQSESGQGDFITNTFCGFFISGYYGSLDVFKIIGNIHEGK